MKQNNLQEHIQTMINKETEISPYLFLSQNIEILNKQTVLLAKQILKYFDIPSSYLYHLENNNENIKIDVIKEFIKKSQTKAPYKFQIFFIENIGNLTIGASNSLLKFFEEPGKGNIIFTTNSGENNILETILSRVNIINRSSHNQLIKNNFIYDMIFNYKQDNNPEIFSYYYRNKLEKNEYILFLQQLILYIKNTQSNINYLDELYDDINGIDKNNLLPKNITDKWLIKIK